MRSSGPSPPTPRRRKADWRLDEPAPKHVSFSLLPAAAGGREKSEVSFFRAAAGGTGRFSSDLAL